MPRTYHIEAYNHNDAQILGNLDGQTAFDAKLPKRVKHVKELIAGYPARPRYSRVKFWRVMNGHREVMRIENPNFFETTLERLHKQ